MQDEGAKVKVQVWDEDPGQKHDFVDFIQDTFRAAPSNTRLSASWNLLTLKSRTK